MRNSSSLDWLRFMHTPNDYRVSHKTSISFNPETSTYLQSFSTESLRQDNQVEIYEGNADVIYVPIEPMN